MYDALFCERKSFQLVWFLFKEVEDRLGKNFLVLLLDHLGGKDLGVCLKMLVWFLFKEVENRLGENFLVLLLDYLGGKI